MIKTLTRDLLHIKIFPSRNEMAVAAANEIETAVCSIISKYNRCNIIFAAAPSQKEVLTTLAASTTIDWARVHAFHMDEYVGISKDAPQGFANYLRNIIFEKVNPGKVEYLHSNADPNAEVIRYSELLRKFPPDLVIMGIGENGHLAFNDPPVADFKDTSLVKIVTLDPLCRQQQVNDGCFSQLSEVPLTALTLTIPVLISAPKVFCIVPAGSKAQAVWNTVNGPVSETCPASILRAHSDAVLYLDSESSSRLNEV